MRYLVDLPDAGETLTVTVELLYQSIGYRWTQNLHRHDADEINRFLSAYEALSNQPVIVAVITRDVEAPAHAISRP